MKNNLSKLIILLIMIWGCSDQIMEPKATSDSGFVLAYDTISLGEIFLYDSSTDNCINITSDIVDTSYYSFVSSFSSDGRKLLFTVDYLKPGNEGRDYCRRNDIFYFDLCSKEIVRLSDNEIKEIYPRFSINGEYIIYTSIYNDKSEIHIMDSSGDNKRCIVSSPSYKHSPRLIMNDKKILYYYYSDSNGEKEFYLNDLSGNNEEQLTFNGVQSDPSISKTEDYFIYSSNLGITKYDFNTNTTNLLIPHPNRTGFDINLRPKISSDDNYIVYLNTKDGHVFLYDLVDETSTDLGKGSRADFTTDGKKIIILNWGNISIYNISTKNTVVVPHCNKMYRNMVVGSIQ